MVPPCFSFVGEPRRMAADAPHVSVMEKVYVFISTGRFRSSEELRGFIDATYTEDGDKLPSPFMQEVGLCSFEPGCIEAIFWGHPTTLPALLKGASYADQWLPKVDAGRTADAAICVFAPNRVPAPNCCSLEYIGSYQYEVAGR